MNQPIISGPQRAISRPSGAALPVSTALLALLITCAPAVAEDATLRDCAVTARARQALLQDHLLAPLNLGVTVRAGVASVWGKVPSAGLGRRAEDKVRKVPGIDEVRSDLQVEAVEDAVAEFLRSAAAAAQRPSLDTFLSPPPSSTAYLTSRWADLGSSPAARSGSGSPGIVLLAPVSEAAAPLRPEAEELAAAIERLRQTDPRFDGLRAEVQGHQVRLSGTVARGGDTMDFARNASRLPGVERVVIGEVRIAVALPGRQ